MGFAAKGVLRWGEAVSPPGMVWGEESGGADVLCRLWAPGGKDGMKAEKSHSHHPVELCRSVGWAAPPLHGVDPCAAAHPLSLGHQSQSIGDVMSWGHFPKEQSPLSPLPPPPPRVSLPLWAPPASSSFYSFSTLWNDDNRCCKSKACVPRGSVSPGFPSGVSLEKKRRNEDVPAMTTKAFPPLPFLPPEPGLFAPRTHSVVQHMGCSVVGMVGMGWGWSG